MAKAKITEIFRSIQGEGIFQGIEQVFVRFQGCNIDCKFCDTKLKEHIECTPSELFEIIQGFDKPFHSVSITGGEPLIHTDFLKEFLPLLKSNNITAYLETNGTMPYALDEVIEHIDIIAMDFKLPSSTGSANFWDMHQCFLERAKEKLVFVKAIICNSTKKNDIDKSLEILRNIDRYIPFILQPNTFELADNLMKKISDFYRYCSRDLENVRIIPQVHKLIGVK